MTASAGAWYRVGTVNVIAGSQSVTGVGTNWQNDVVSIAIGDIFTIDAKTWYEVTVVNSDTSITLDRVFEGNTASGENYAIVRNTSGTILTRIAGQVSVQFNQKQLFIDELRTWLNSDNASEELTDSHGVKQSIKTPAQMVRDHDNKLAELDAIHPHPWAMRKVEFEALRAANNEKFAASGFVHLGKQQEGSNYGNVGQGLWTGDIKAFEDKFILGARVTDKGLSKTNYPVVNLSGVLTKLEFISSAHESTLNLIKLPPAEDGTRTYDSSTGLSVKHSTPALAFASETATNKVVTDRVDMWGLEGFLREINDTDPFVYKNGLLQSLAPEISGVATTDDNVRPATYFAWYDGDTESRGKGVNWQTATEGQRISIACDLDNNIYFDDETGKFYQWCLRGRSFAGLGNGTWLNVDTTGAALAFSNENRVGTHGIRDIARGWLSQGSDNLYYGNYKPANPEGVRETGLFTVFKGLHGALDGHNKQCCFLVGNTIDRLNKGAYHTQNQTGSARLNATVSSSAGRYWHQAEAIPPSSREDLFNPVNGAADNTTAGYTIGSGSIDSGFSGRHDGRYFNGIYSNGEGAVCRDMRYSAKGVTDKDFADHDLLIKNGEYRGLEYLTFTKVYDLGVISPDSSSGSYPTLSYTVNALYSNIKELEEGDHYYVFNKTTGETFDSRTVNLFVTSSTRRHLYYPTAWGSNVDVSVIFTERTKRLVSYIFTVKEVLGHPSDILNCNDLIAGWVGLWNPTVPAGQTTKVDWSRPVLENPISGDILLTDDLGESWISGTSSAWLESTITNKSTSLLLNAGRIVMYQYRTKARATKLTNNAKLYGGLDSIGKVLASSRARNETARFLGFSLISKVLTSHNVSNVGKDHESLSLNGIQLGDGLGMLLGTGVLLSNHAPLNLGPPLNKSPAFKALNYNVVENQQAFINYAYTELTYDAVAGDWGDDGKIHIADNQTTMPDENGHTVLVGTARCVEPLGWLKNDK